MTSIHLSYFLVFVKTLSGGMKEWPEMGNTGSINSMCFDAYTSHMQHIPVTVVLFCSPLPSAASRTLVLLDNLVFVSLS
jgi:hypothetical protein